MAGSRAGVSVDETVALCVSRSASEAIDVSVTKRSAYASARVGCSTSPTPDRPGLVTKSKVAVSVSIYL